MVAGLYFGNQCENGLKRPNIDFRAFFQGETIKKKIVCRREIPLRIEKKKN